MSSDATRVAVGTTFLGVAGVMASILLPLAAAAKAHPWGQIWFLAPGATAGLFAILGVYVLAAVYIGWPLPLTAMERIAAPRLSLVGTSVVRDSNGIVFGIKFMNEGKADIPHATVNVVVPTTVSDLQRVTPEGKERQQEEGGVYETARSIATNDQGQPLPSRYWAGPVRFPGGVTRSLHFKVGSAAPSAFPILVSVTAPELDESFEAQTTIV